MTAELDRGVAALKARFDSSVWVRLGTQGDCRRKNHSPTGPYSEHAWPGGNAVDVMLGGDSRRDPDVKRRGDLVAAWMRSRPDLWSEVFWQVAAHFDHVHGTANPRRNYDNKQIPPCAGGPSTPPEEDALAILTDDEQVELQKFLQLLEDMGSNVSFVKGLIPDMRKNVITRDELTAALADLPTGESTEATITEIRRRLTK